MGLKLNFVLGGIIKMTKYCIKSGYTKDFVRGVKRAKLDFKTKKEAKRYLRNNVIEENKFKIVKC